LPGFWPAAQSLGVSRQTFETATRGLEPDLSLQDLDLPGRAPPPGQPEFIQSPADYVSEASISRLAEQGKRLAIEHRATLAGIERQSACRRMCARDLGARDRLRHLQAALQRRAGAATQAYIGKRKEKFREEFLLALKIVDEGHVKLADMKSSWAGAMGLTQFLPSEFYKYAVDFDGDGSATSGPRYRTRWRRPRSNSPPRAGSRVRAGPTR